MFARVFSTEAFVLLSDVFKTLSREIKVEGDIYNFIEAYMKYNDDQLKIIKEEYGSKFAEYRDIDENEMNEYINKKIGEFPIHQLLQQLNLID